MWLNGVASIGEISGRGWYVDLEFDGPSLWLELFSAVKYVTTAG